MNTYEAMEQYRQVGVRSDIPDASPYRLVQMLMQGALDKLAAAKGCMARGDIAGKGSNISGVISIVDGLRASLDKDTGGQIALNLENLYLHIIQQLLQANIDNDAVIIDKVYRLIAQIKSAWDDIGGILDNAVTARPAALEQGLNISAG